MLKKCCISFLLLFSLLTGNCLLFTACSEDEAQSEWIRPAELNDIDSYIKAGILLDTYQEENGQYTFTFENQTTVNLSTEEVINVQNDPDRWMTILTLANNQEYNIPTQGTSIESFIKDIKVNPSGYCPLSASIHLELPAKGRFSVKVLSKKGAVTPDQEHQYGYIDNYTQDVLVLGLYANYTNQVILTYLDKNGNSRGETTLNISTSSLNIKRMPNHKIISREISRMEPGMTLIACPGESDTDTSLPYMIDADGEIRWVLDWETHPELNHMGAHCGLFRMKNGNYVTGDINNGQIVVVNALGELVNSWNFNDLGFTFHHEVQETKEERFLIAATKIDAKVADNSNARILDHIVELNPKSGTLSQIWDLAQVLDSSRITFAIRPDGYEPNTFVQSPMNWCHNNGVTETRDGSILISSRWQGLVKFTRSGELKWIIGPHDGWKEEYRKFLLTPLDRNGNPITDLEVLNGEKNHPDFSWGWGIHCPKELPNGHVMLFDNGYSRLYNFKDGEKYSRAVEYEVNEQDMTVRQVWEYGRERGRNCFSTQVSGTQYLPQTNNRLFCPGIGNQVEGGYGGHVIEINATTGDVVFEMEVQSTGSPAFHRANRLSLYPENL